MTDDPDGGWPSNQSTGPELAATFDRLVAMMMVVGGIVEEPGPQTRSVDVGPNAIRVVGSMNDS
jgi:hypothetical protein